nr:hypothetical protein [uncultured Allomuricauda sp.]
MKKIKNYSLTLGVSFLLSSCCSLFGVDCDQCEEAKSGIELADLLLNDFEGEKEEDEERGTFFRVVHTILNFASDFECPEEVKAAGSHQDQLQLIYYNNEDTDFANPTLVETQNVSIDKTTQPDKQYSIRNEIVFEQDGVYDLESNIDRNNEVPERNENNNSNSNSPLAKGYRPNPSNLIYVTKDMLGKNGVDHKKSNKFIKEWKIIVE